MMNQILSNFPEGAPSIILFSSIVATFSSSIISTLISWMNNRSRRLDNLNLFRVKKLISIRGEFDYRYHKSRAIIIEYIQEICEGKDIDNHPYLKEDAILQMNEDSTKYCSFVSGGFREVLQELIDFQMLETNILKRITEAETQYKWASQEDKDNFKEYIHEQLVYLDKFATNFIIKADRTCYILVRNFGLIGKIKFRIIEFFTIRYHLGRRVWLREVKCVDFDQIQKNKEL